MMRRLLTAFALLLGISGLAGMRLLPAARAQEMTTAGRTDALHQTAEWSNIALHLPDPASAAPAVLETAADTLRARRYQGDAIAYYNAAIARGGNPGTLMKKIGIACLELQQPKLARMSFDRAVHLNTRDAVAWNDLGAADFSAGDVRAAISEYRRATKLDKRSAVFHSNLALALFEHNETGQARRELARAFQLDPDLAHRGNQGGYSAQVLTAARYAQICFEMAKIYAAQGDVATALDWLTKASERGYNVRSAMQNDPGLRALLSDPRVDTMLRNSQNLHTGTGAKAQVKVPSLGESTP